MRKIIYACITVLLVSSGCKVAEKEFRKGNYDEAINICVKKLIDNPDKAEYIVVLEEAFARANGEDLAMIDALNREGQPDRWEEIYYLYNDINIRQNKIKPLLPIYLGKEERDAEFNFVNTLDQMNNAKKNASAYWYAKASENLKTNDMYKARDAYWDLQKIQGFYGDYKDVDDLLVKAKIKGTNDVLFVIKNNSGATLSYDVSRAMQDISLENNYGQWYEIHTKMPESALEFTIELSLKQIEAFPEKVSTKMYTDSKQITDGYEFQYDDQGNIVKDSLGNPVKVPDYKTITAQVTETWQEKVATVGGEIRYIDKTGKTVKTVPLKSDGVFQNYYAAASGYYEALSQESKNKLGGKPMPFPGDNEMIIQAMQVFEAQLNDIIHGYNEDILNQ